MNKKNDLSIQLINVKDIASRRIPMEYESFTNELILFNNWVANFLSKPHLNLGRTGAVCPYVQYAAEKEYFKVGVYEQENPDQAVIIMLIRNLRSVFLEMTSANRKDEKFKAVSILFPKLKEGQISKIIDEVQHILKPEFVSMGLMIGQFYENCQEGGLRNTHFKPLQSPIPLLAIRYMVETDWPFLEGDKLLEKAYLENFGRINFGKKTD
ncbi:DUF6875 domain-containing protein [Pedobacter agri]|uniref:DUF6875 domain-containing protein n=1 Tax=Pedobacter agri TaxID=454586 RepID=UPI00292D489B|nr:hypothetical protein [Pedobacter agri]